MIVVCGGAVVDHFVTEARRRQQEHDPEKWLPVFRKDHELSMARLPFSAR
jgi:hypothetical protein